MSILLLNGSPRKGNTVRALEALKKGFDNIKDVKIEEIDAADVNVSPCIACVACKSGECCIFDDDTNEIIDEILNSDTIVFATPVYWWGITAQLKLIVDKLYSQLDKLKKSPKKVGLIVIGEAELDDPQYQIIYKQFECICDYLGWELIFYNKFSAYEADDLNNDQGAIAEIEGLWEKIKNSGK